MKTLTDLALNKMANNYLNSLSHVLYKLDGEEKRLEFFKKKVKKGYTENNAVVGNAIVGNAIVGGD